jgi:uncharacterized protein YcaQ
MPALPSISASSARRLLLGAQKLLDAPDRKATRATLERLVVDLGFVQMDSINVVARAHDIILWSRLEDYRPALLRRLLEQERALFEHWTHDASAIPTAWYAHWKARFERDRARMQAQAWWQKLLGEDQERVCAHVLERIAREGPLGSADFEHPEKRGPWWDWKPQKAALDFLWRCGELAIAGRKGFQKRYDLPERVLPEHHALPRPEPAEHRAWACAGAAERLVVFTPRELAGFWGLVTSAEAGAWCAEGTQAGRLQAVQVEVPGGKPLAAFALADWEARLRGLPGAPAQMRFLAPFDPVLRDRARCLRLFGFDYRFEAFTPPVRRVHGYYVLPILEGERLVGRLDPKLHRDRGVLEIRGLWWEPGVALTRTRKRLLAAALERLARFVGADAIERSAPGGP